MPDTPGRRGVVRASRSGRVAVGAVATVTTYALAKVILFSWTESTGKEMDTETATSFAVLFGALGTWLSFCVADIKSMLMEILIAKRLIRSRRRENGKLD